MRKLRHLSCAISTGVCAALILGAASGSFAADNREAGHSLGNPRNAQFAGLDLYPKIAALTADDQESRKSDDARLGGNLAVIYPVLGEPYNRVFAGIIDGIRSSSKLTVQTYPQTPSVQVDLKRQLKDNDTKAAIVLGRDGFEKIASLDKDLPVLLSGVVSFTEDNRYSAISLAPDPAILFARLKLLLPQVTKVHIVTNPKRNARILKDARDAAKTTGIELVEREATDLAAAAKHYEAIFKSVDGRSEVVWLTQDTTVLNEDHILPMILELSWNRRVPVISSTLAHVPRGVLFAAFPDNVRLGQTLAQSAMAIALDKSKRIYAPLRDLRAAVNVRTAGHLGIRMSPRVQSSFDYTFPEY